MCIFEALLTLFQNEVENLGFCDKFVILLEQKISGVAGL